MMQAVMLKFQNLEFKQGKKRTTVMDTDQLVLFNIAK